MSSILQEHFQFMEIIARILTYLNLNKVHINKVPTDTACSDERKLDGTFPDAQF